MSDQPTRWIWTKISGNRHVVTPAIVWRRCGRCEGIGRYPKFWHPALARKQIPMKHIMCRICEGTGMVRKFIAR